MTSPSDAAALQLRLAMLEKRVDALMKITCNLLRERQAVEDLMKQSEKCDAAINAYSDGFTELLAPAPQQQ